MKQRRKHLRQGSKVRLPEVSPASFRKLFQGSPTGYSYSRSLSLLFADLRAIRRNRGSDYDSIPRPGRISMLSKVDSRSSQKLKIIPRPLTPIHSAMKSAGSNPVRNRNDHSKSGLEVSFITLDLEPGSYRPQRRRTKHLDQLPLVYLAKLPVAPAPHSSSICKSPTPVVPPTPPLAKPHKSRLRHISDSRSIVLPKAEDVTSLGPWLEDY